MNGLEKLLGLFVAAVVLAALARRAGAPYPVFLAVGGALLAFLPIGPTLNLPPELVLALFVAPVLLDAAYDTSVRDLRDNWAPLAGLVFAAVGLTTAVVAWVAHTLVPGMPWAVAVALGAIVAPPDAVAATAVLRTVNPPHRILAILEGEGLLNDASALLIYKLALGAVAAGGFSFGDIGPTFLLAVVGGMVAGLVLGRATLHMMERIAHIPTAIILQFVCTFGVWIAADRLGLSAVLTIVCFALTMARTGPRSIPARTRIATNVVWGTAVFALNILAFIFIGLQIRPIIDGTAAADRPHYFMVSAAVLASVIVVRLVWHMLFNGVTRWRHRRSGFNPPRPLLRPSVGSGLVISWSGMRGIVTLAAALALPADFAYRGLVVLCAAVVVLGTLVIQGLSLKPLLRMLDLHDDDPVGREEKAAYAGALQAALASIENDSSAAADAVRKRLHAQFDVEDSAQASASTASSDPRNVRIELYGRALGAARDAVLAMRSNEAIGDDAFHRIERRLDWIEMARPN